MFCGCLKHQEKKSSEAVVASELGLVMYDRLVLRSLDQFVRDKLGLEYNSSHAKESTNMETLPLGVL